MNYIKVFYLCLVGLLLGAAQSKAADEPILSLASSGVRYEVPWPQVGQSDSLKFDVPVTIGPAITSAQAATVQIRLVSVRLGNQVDESSGQAFSVAQNLFGQPERNLLRVTVYRNRLTQPGTYSLTLATQLLERSTGNIILEVAVLPALFRPASKLTINQFCNALPGWDSEPLMPLTVQPSNRAVKLTNLSATLDGGQLAPRGGLRFVVTAPNGVVNLKPVLTGEFPLGTFSGSVLVRATQFADPMVIPFEVHSRRSTWLILLLLGLGVGVGYLVRKHLQDRIELRDAQQQIGQLLTEIKRQKAHATDSLLIKGLNDLEGKLITQLEAAEVTKLKESHTEVADSLKQELAAFEKRLLDAQTGAQEARTLLNTKWQMPAPLDSILDTARASLVAIDQLLVAGNAQDALTGITQLQQRLTEQVNIQLPTWKLSREAMLGSIGKVIPPSQQPAWKNVEAILIQQIQAVTVNPTGMPVDKLTDALSVMHDVEINLAARIADVIRDLTTVFNIIRQDLAAEPALGQPALLTQLQPLLLDFEQQLKASQSDIRVPKLEASTFIRSVGSILEEQLPAGSKDDVKSEIKSLLTNADFLVAAGSIKELYKKQGDDSESMHELVTESVDATAYTLPFTINYSNASTPMIGVNFSPDLRSVLGLTQWRATIKSLRSQTRWLQASLIAVVLIWIGYVLFAEDFVGSPKQVLTVFLWGFFSDLTIDRLQAVSPTTKQMG